jgi:hypothetical protein
MLLQVQWVPRDAAEPKSATDVAEDEEEVVCGLLSLCIAFLWH